MPTFKHTSVSASLRSACRGLRHGLIGRNLRIQLAISLGIFVLSCLAPISTTEHLILLLAVIGMLSLELINTALEELADVLIQEHHPGIAKVKELAAGAVLLSSLAVAAISAYIFLPYLT